MLGNIRFDLEKAFSDDHFQKCSQSSLSRIQQFLNPSELLNLSITQKQMHQRLSDQLVQRFKTKIQSYLSVLGNRKAEYLRQKNMKFQKIDENGDRKQLKIKYYDLPRWFFDSGLAKQSENVKIEDYKVDFNSYMLFEIQDIQMIVNRSLIDDKLYLEKQIKEEDKAQMYQQFYSDDKEMEFDMQNIIYRQKKILNNIKKEKDQQEQQQMRPKLLTLIEQLNKPITIILCHGGHFSIAVYQNHQCLFHKSDHKYVVRKKQGQRQLNKDKAHQPKSMGSQIRRENENKHQKNIQGILDQNEKWIELSSLVFLQAPGMNKLMLLQQNPILSKNIHKLKSLALSAKKANYQEIERIYAHICQVKIIF